MIEEKTKEAIDEMSYHQMLYKWRHSPAGHWYFQGETGEYYKKVMFEKKAQLENSEQVSISKSIGW